MPIIHVATQRPSLRLLRSIIAASLLATSSIVAAQGQPAAVDKDGLPPNFRPPRAVVDVINLEDELTTEEAYTQWKKKELANFVAALKQPRLNPQQIKQIEDGCKIRVQRLSLKALRLNLKPVRVEVYRDVHLQATPASRDVALKAITAEAERLLAGNLTVRLQAIILLSELESVPANPAKNAPATLYSEVLNVYFKVLSDKKQPEAVRLSTAASTERVLQSSGLTTNPPHKLRLEAGKVLVPLAEKRDESDFYQKAVIGALQAVNLPTLPDAGNTQQPLIATTLHKLLNDNARSLPVRTRAAQALGQVQLPQAGIDVATMTKDYLKVGRAVVNDYNANAQGRIRNAFLLQDLYTGLKSWKNAAPNDKNVASAYSAIVKPTAAAINALNANSTQPGPIPATVLEDINGIVGAEKAPSGTGAQGGVIAKPNN